jgi:hypothetical protein
MAEYLASPGDANQIVVIEDTPVGLELPARCQEKSIDFIGGAHQLDEIASLRC